MGGVGGCFSHTGILLRKAKPSHPVHKYHSSHLCHFKFSSWLHVYWLHSDTYVSVTWETSRLKIQLKKSLLLLAFLSYLILSKRITLVMWFRANRDCFLKILKCKYLTQVRQQWISGEVFYGAEICCLNCCYKNSKCLQEAVQGRIHLTALPPETTHHRAWMHVWR